MNTGSGRAYGRAAIVLIALAISFALSTTAAFAASTYFEQTPAVGGICTQAMPLISVKVSDPAGISTGFQLKVDGVTRTPKIKWGPNNAYVQLYYQTTSPLANGTHTVYASVFTGAGRTSTTWTFTSKAPPVVGPMAPADGSVVDSQKPVISAVVKTNGGSLASYAMTVDDASVAATYDGATKTVSYTPLYRLANDRVHTASLTVTDGLGATTTVTWSFTVQIYADMLDTAGCTECHTTYPTAHPMTNCMGCHAQDAPFGAYWNMDDLTPVHGSDYLMGIDCSYCHASVFPTVPTHPRDVSDLHLAGADMSGCSCHVSDLTVEHNRYTTDAGDPITCASCHQSTDPQVQAGMAAGTRMCPDCHTIPAGHPYAEIDHVADVAEVADLSGKTCGSCHEMDLMTEHQKPTSSSTGRACTNCHDNPRTTFDTWNDTCSQGGCHAAGSATEMHGGMTAAHAAPEGVACIGCHTGAVSTIHAEATSTVGGVEVSSCSICHQPGTAPSKDCLGCHPDRITPHGYKAEKHAAAPTSGVTISGVSFDVACASCHELELGPLHTTATCDSCHGALVTTLKSAGGWDKSCAQADCHAGASPLPMHADVNTSHVIPAAQQTTCITSGCHDASSSAVFDGKSLADLHAAATTTVEGVTRTSCQICHAAGSTPTGTCTTVGCHAERAQPHGYPAEAHVANESCVLDCHTATTGMTELKPLHDAATGTSFTCTACHATLVPAMAEQYPAGWNQTCVACHSVATLHPARSAQHTGTDVAYQAASFFGNGCSDSTGHTGQSACHNISNVAAVHQNMAGNGCPACHGPGKTPAQECYTCHKPGYATTYTVPGTPSANIYSYPSPTSDNYLTPGWTYTTTPASQPIYNVVNTPAPPANTTRYVTVTSNLAGQVLFGYTPQTIPSNARITDVRIYAKGKAATASPLRKMQGVFKIGGTQYLTSGTGTNLTTAWTATTVGANYGSTSTRLDFTRDQLYGEMIWRNPKTGLDWTPDELNGTDPDSSLEAFGMNVTSSATANNVSLSQVYLKITYYTVGDSVTNPTVGTHTYHGDNVKYIHDPSDVPAGQRFAVNPAHGWYDALYYQDCYDFCHRGNGGDPTFSAEQGEWMWYSVGGDPSDTYTLTRTLTLRPVTIPAGSPALTFRTNYILGTGAAGYVEASRDGGSNWAALTGDVGGSSTSSISGSAGGWTSASYDLSAYAGQSVKLRFRYVNGSSTTEGWAFDTLAITNGATTVFSDNAETLKPDWTNKYWTRSKGAFPFQ